jgi:hypothetical protein
MTYVNSRVFSLMLTTLLLFGCQTMPQELPQRPVSLLNVDEIFPSHLHGTYLQKITTTANGQEHTFTVHLNLSQQKVDFVAFDDIYGRLYHLVWTPENKVWQACEHVPATMRPEHIMEDFLLVHMPVASLKSSLQGASVREQGGVRQNWLYIENGPDLLRKIHCSGPMGTMWQHVTIENPQMGYKLDIQTVPIK